MYTPIGLIVALQVSSLAGAQQPAAPRRAAAAVHPAAQEVARVNGVPIPDGRLTVAVNALIPLQSFHRNVTDEKMASLRQKALDGLVDEELQYQDGVRRGITITTVEVDRMLRDVTKRYGGQQKREQAQAKAGVTLRQLRGDIRRALVVEKAYARTVTAKCQVSNEETAQYFRDHPDQFVQPEQLHIFAITIGVDPSSPSAKWAEAKTQAEDILDRIRHGASFEDMARTYSTDDSKTTGGDMGFLHRGTLTEDFEKATANLPLGQASEVVRTLYGYHIVRVTGIKPPERKTFSEVGTGLQKDLTSRRCKEVGDAWTSRLRSSATIVIASPQPQAKSEAPGRRP